MRKSANFPPKPLQIRLRDGSTRQGYILKILGGIYYIGDIPDTQHHTFKIKREDIESIAQQKYTDNKQGYRLHDWEG